MALKMKYKVRKYYFNQIKDVYLYCKNILGTTCIKEHIFKKKVDGFDGYFKFDIKHHDLEKELLIDLNNQFDNYWNRYHYLKLEANFINEEYKIDLKSHFFYIILIIFSLAFNIFLMINSYFHNGLIIALGIIMFLIPSLIYIFKIFIFKNSLNIISKKLEKINKELINLNNKMLKILKKSPYYEFQDLKNFLIDYPFNEENKYLEDIKDKIGE